MNPTSDVIADTYADLLHRNLLREGLAIWRYADDFRIACASYGDCIEALELFDKVARNLGLTLNERKTLTPSIDTYRDMIEGPQRRFDRINEAVREDLTGFDSYSWEDVTPEDAEVLLEGAIRVMDIWSEQEKVTDLVGADMSQLVPQALMVLNASSNDYALQYVPKLLRFEPQLTPIVCRYASAMAEQHGLGVDSALRATLDELTLTRWQRIWLLTVLEELDPVADPWSNDDLLNWMRKQAEDQLIPLRCQAIWSLSRSRRLRISEWSTVDSVTSRYEAPYAAAAMPGIHDASAKSLAALMPVNLIDKVVWQWSDSTYFAPPF